MSEEVTNPFGMSGASDADPAMLAAQAEARTLKDKQVVDVNGQTLGRITRAFAQDGALTRLDVHLTNQARQIFGDTRETVGVPADAIGRVEGDTVRLTQAGEQVLHPEDPRSTSATRDERGAPELPRKNR